LRSTTIDYLIHREANMRRTVCREFTYVACREPRKPAVSTGSPRSIPLFRADFLHSTSKIVEHSRYLPSNGNDFIQILQQFSPQLYSTSPQLFII